MREGWREMAINSLLDLSIGGVWGSNPGEADQDVWIVRSTNFRGDGRLDPSASVRRSLSARQINSRQLRTDDILLEKSGGGPNQPVGRVARVSELDDVTVCSNFVQMLRPKPGLVNAAYLWLVLWHRHFMGLTLSYQSQTTGIRNLRTKDYLATPILLPPLDEQRRIVDLISTVDEAIDAANKVAETARRARKALLSDLLSNERAQREGWREMRLDDIAQIVGGGTPRTSKPDFWNGDVVWLTPTEVVAAEGTVITDSQRKITRAGLRSSGATLLPPNTVLLTSRATVGAVAIAGCELATNQGFQSLVANDTILPWFLLMWIQHNKGEFTRRASGSTFPEISRSKVRQIPISVPALEEQQQIVDLIKAVNDEIDTAGAVVNRTRALRSALLSDLLSGKHEIPASYDEVLELAA